MNEITQLAPPLATPAAPGAAVVVDELADHVRRLRTMQTHIKSLQAAADEIKAAIQDAMGEAEVATVHGRTVATWTHHTRHALDQRALKEHDADVYERHLKASTVRRFTLMEDDASL